MITLRLPSRRMASVLAVLALLFTTACTDSPSRIAEFWRPVSEPNIQMSIDKLQSKLDFDLSQCHCGTFPTNVSRSDAIAFQPDQQRLAQTSVTVKPDEEGACIQQPSLVVSECMRSRGWEKTNCSGRMPLAGGASLCAAYAY